VFKLDKKKIIILSSTLCVVLVGGVINCNFRNKSEDNNTVKEVVTGIEHKSGYAYDTKESMKKVYIR
jgi:hypothetical protein